MKINRFLICLFISATFINCSSKQDSNRQRPDAVSYNYTPTDTSWKSMTVREKIGQTMIVLAYYNAQKEQFGSLNEMQKQYPVGGIFIPSWQFGNHKPESEIILNIQNCMREYDKAAKWPLLITEDFERGVGFSYQGYTDMPVEMSLGAANSPKLAQAYGNATAKEASTLGINWLLHPVSDLNMNPLQDLVVERSLTDDPKRAYPLLKAQINGISSQGVVPTIKHFPGDGATSKNQHLITSANNLSMEEWNATYGTLFQNLINDGAPCIMVGHIRFPAYQKKLLKGLIPPASLSDEVMVQLLKNEMKFNGVIISDALNMGGIGGYYPNIMETAVACFVAGVDIVLWPDLAYMDTVEARIKRGEIPMSRLDDAVERIWGVREKYNLLQKKQEICYVLSPSDKTEIEQTVTKVAQKGVTLITDSNNEIPLTPAKTKKIAIINISYKDMTPMLNYTKELLEAKGFEVSNIIYNPNLYAWQSRLHEFDNYDKVIVAFENKYLAPIGSSFLKDAEAMGIWTASMIPFEKIIAISYSNPYYVNYYCDDAPIRINAYSIDKFTQKAVIDALTGEIPFEGTSPVELNSQLLN